MSRTLIIVLFLVAPVIALAQADSIASWYPLHLADRWQYREIGGSEHGYLWTVDVVAETTTLSGTRYARLHDSRGGEDVYERVDTAGVRVIRWDPQTGAEVAVDSLAGALDDVRQGSRIWESLYRCSDIRLDTILGVPTMVRDWTALIIPNNYSYGIGKGFGIVGFTEIHADAGCGGYCGLLIEKVLQYARIDGVEYGTFLGVEGPEAVPSAFVLGQNYPNPFNPRTRIPYELPAAGHLRLSVYDLLGRELARLVDEQREPGRYAAEWDAGLFGSGVYVCRMEAGGLVRTTKLLLIK